MRTLSKIMAVAVLALVAGSAHAGAAFSQDGPKAADGAAVLTIALPGVGVASTVYTFTAPAGVTVVGTNTITTDAGGLSADTVQLVSSLAANYNIAFSDTGATDTGNVVVAFIQNTLDVTITVTLTVPVQVALNDGVSDVAAITWNLPGKTLNTTYTSNVTDPQTIDIANRGGAAVNVKAQLNSPGSWIATTQAINNTTIDRFWVNATGVDSTAQLVVAPSANITNSILPNTTSSTSLTFHTPLTVSTTNSGNIIVRYVAANN